MASSTNDEAQVLRIIDDSDGVDTILAKDTTSGEVFLVQVKVDKAPPYTEVVHLRLDYEEMDILTTWWRNRRLHEKVNSAS